MKENCKEKEEENKNGILAVLDKSSYHKRDITICKFVMEILRYQD